MKTIWILNHYAGQPEFTTSSRHYKFAENLTNMGYNVKIFTASFLAGVEKNLINDRRKYLYKELNRIGYIFVKTSSYVGNGMTRIKNMASYAIKLISVTRKFESEKPNVILASSVHPLTWVSGYILARRYHAKFIAETRDLWPESLIAMGIISRKSIFAKFLYALERFIYKRADKLIFTFPGGHEYIRSIGLDESKVRYINNGVDVEEFKYNMKNNVYIDDVLDNRKLFKIIYTGSMGISNALNYLVEAAGIIQSKGLNDIVFVLFGTGYIKKELEVYITNKKIKNVILRDRVEKKYIPNILSRSNLNVFTGLPIYIYKYGISLNKMFDYFASRKPTLSNLECGYDIIERYHCGITVKSRSAEALVEGILRFYNMPEEEYNIFCSNAAKAAEDFDYKKLSRKLEEIFTEA